MDTTYKKLKCSCWHTAHCGISCTDSGCDCTECECADCAGPISEPVNDPNIYKVYPEDNGYESSLNMYNLAVSKNTFNSDGFWTQPVAKLVYIPTRDDLDLFDQNGYDLTELEKHFASSNIAGPDSHRCHRTALKKEWLVQPVSVTEGPHLNHSLLFERKGYSGRALAQLKMWSQDLPLIHKLISIRPKWGLDFSMDYADRDGNVFEVLHWEWDSFDYNEILAVKQGAEQILLNIDWADAAKTLLNRKDEWHHLDFFAQSDWKCEFFGITKEQFKMVIWK